ncbi:DUF4200 domain-containing protein [Pseudoflavitalea sp. X16]|uniref:DUF4200 domain-containing protein n=1 Tax=Paraflavitalea devenefica TaxID=2716334 RepID=UPI00141F9B2F|nr:DUF4200 domain-containing protein [Paraflavitalea devenefica]NII25638.1 DUF4200 domain-containing protein [Paraflavitalea devenefica]
MDNNSNTKGGRKEDFGRLQQQIAKQRIALREQTKALQESNAKKTLLEQKLRKESTSTRDTGSIKKYTEELKKIKEGIGMIKGRITELERGLGDFIGEIILELDPRQQVELMDDDYPVFLLPVRVETRFMIVKHIARLERDRLPQRTVNFTVNKGRRIEKAISYPVKELYESYTVIPVVNDLHELWIRIFPDDIAIHTHEEELTEAEVTAGKTFWTNKWYAGKNESLELSAWRGLVSGRTPERAAWISNQTTPLNPGDAPAAPVDPANPLPIEPQFPVLPEKASSWSNMPHARVMPDRFVVRLYNGNTYREVVGKRLPDRLPVSLDPQDEGTDLDNTDGKLILPENLRWVQDFDEAEKIGMAIRVPLSLEEKNNGFDKLLVLGIKVSADKDEGQALVEELVDNHHYTPGGFSIVAQGTPTNNTEDSLSGYTSRNADDDELFKIEMANQFTPVADDLKKDDGQRLAEALGIRPEKVQHVRNAGLKDIREAMCMNNALWPTTLGYYLSQMMHPVFSDPEIANTKAHFHRFVLGRGRIPAIRVGDQPYGILPTTAFSKLTYTGNATNIVLLRNLFEDVLKKMEITWDKLAEEVKHADQPFSAATTDKAFLEILGLHPSSVEFYQRQVTGPYVIWNLYYYSLLINGLPAPSSISYATIYDFATLFNNMTYFYYVPPRVFNFIYAAQEKRLDGPVIDPFPFSETRTLNAIGSNGENYIDWLYKSDYDTIRREDFSNIGAPGAVPPKSLLYLMLRHSCLLEYVHSGINMLAGRGYVNADLWLDHELLNVGTARKLSMEARDFARARVEFKEGAALHKELQAQVDAAFTKRADSGLLSGFSFRDVEREKLSYYNELKTAAAPAYKKMVDELVDKELSSIVYTASKTGVLAEKYDFIGDATSFSKYIDAEIRKPGVIKELQEMADVRDALNCLKGLPTARLERLFSEHVDLASYRLDAWFFSLAAQRLEQLRTAANGKNGVYIGAYSWLENVQPGKFPGIVYREVEIEKDRFIIPGIYEVAIKDFEFPIDIVVGPVKTIFKPGIKALADSKAEAALKRAPQAKEATMSFLRGDMTVKAPLIGSGGVKMILDTVRENVIVDFPGLMDAPVVTYLGPAYIYLGTDAVGDITYDNVTNQFISNPRVDPGNQGYIHAPSINHASTAALLRAGYESHKINAGSNDNAFAVNLTSGRVRRAMSYLEGIRNGQELAALLGYQFERALHDLNLNLDKYIRDIRLKYPFVAARVTSSSGAVDINEAEAYNVVDGLKLMEAFRDNPLHWADGITFSPASDKTKIATEIEGLMDSMDAVHDLLLSESVHQAVQGNTARSSAAFNAIAGNAVPPEPQIIETPRGFHALTHRVGVLFDASPGGAAIWTAAGTARSLAEPKLNRWLGAQLPAKEKIVINISYTTVVTNGSLPTTTDLTMTAGELKIEPVDLVYLMDISLETDVESDLYELISYYIRQDVAAADNITIQIKNADRTGLDPDEITLTELKPLAASLLKIVQDGKILDAKDFILPTDTITEVAANPGAGLNTAGLLSRLQDAAGLTMSNGQRGLSGLYTDLQLAITDLAANIPPFPQTFDPLRYVRVRAALLHSTYFGIPKSVPETASTHELNDSQELLLRARQVLPVLKKRKEQADALLASVATQANEPAKLRVLLQAGEAIFGRSFRLFPDFTFYTPAAVTAAMSYSGYLDTAGVHAVDEWIQGLAPVRKRMHNLQQYLLFSSILTANEGDTPLRVIQFPLAPVDTNGDVQARWVGMKLPDGYVIPQDNLSLVFSYPPGFNVNALQAGMIIDEWVEEIPVADAQTGLAVHYNNPNSETPNACLLAVSPDLNGSWSWDDLMDTLYETLQWAKKRAVDPDLLNDTIYAQILPAIMAAMTGTSDTPTLDFGRNCVDNPKRGVLDIIRLEDYTHIQRLWAD